MKPNLHADDSDLVEQFRGAARRASADQQIGVERDPAELDAASEAFRRLLVDDGWGDVASGDASLTLLAALAEANGSVLPTPAFPFVEAWTARRMLSALGTDDTVGPLALASPGSLLSRARPTYPVLPRTDALLHLVEGRDPTVIDVVALDQSRQVYEDQRQPDRTLRWERLSETALGDAVTIGTLSEESARLMAAESVLLQAAELLGCATCVLEKTTAYTSDREQFGRPLAAFQAVRHRLVNVYVEVETLRSLVTYAAWVRASRPEDFIEYALLAKGYAAETAWEAVNAAIQLHGAIGFTYELGLQFPAGRIAHRALTTPTGEQCFDLVGGLMIARGEMLHLVS